MSKFASLTAGLLARKGEAEPTSTPFAEQLLTRVGAPASDIRALTPMHAHVHNHAESGGLAKQQGFKPPPPAKPLDPMTSIFGSFGKRSVLEIARSEHEPAKLALTVVASHDEEEHLDNHCGTCTGPASDDAGKTYHVNLRLKRQRFVKLKLSAALLRRPVQDVVSEALDQWFERLPSDIMGDCACLKARTE
jgi:hypothetical protein